MFTLIPFDPDAIEILATFDPDATAPLVAFDLTAIVILIAIYYIQMAYMVLFSRLDPTAIFDLDAVWCF